MKTIVTIYPPYKDFHFYKDPGQLPLRFSRLGYKTILVCYRSHDKLENTKKYLEVKEIPNKMIFKKYNLGIIYYLLTNRKKIDILNIFHLQYQSLLLGFIFKKINKKGFVYLKMDNCHNCGTYSWQKLFEKEHSEPAQINEKRKLKAKIKNEMVRNFIKESVDLWSIEDEGSKDFYENRYSFFKSKLIVVYNGHAVDLFSKIKPLPFCHKENIIFTASNLGTYAKATDILLQAFKIVAKSTSNWTLHLAGTIDENFMPFIEKYFIENKALKGRIIFHGPLDKSELFSFYNKSKIFCLPSRSEGFANVYAESMYFGNVIVTTPYTSIRDIIKQYKCGLLVEKDDAKELALALLQLINAPSEMQLMSSNSRKFAVHELDWRKIVQSLNEEITSRMQL